MTDEQAKILAHKLTMKYLDNHPEILSNVQSHIPQMVEDIAYINKQFFDTIISNELLNKLY